MSFPCSKKYSISQELKFSQTPRNFGAKNQTFNIINQVTSPSVLQKSGTGIEI